MVITGASERALLRVVLSWLELRGIPAWRNNTGMVKTERRFYRHGCVGSADILGVLPPGGRLLAIECKGPRGRVTKPQRLFLDVISEGGGLAIVARSLDDVMAAIEAVEAGARLKAEG